MELVDCEHKEVTAIKTNGQAEASCAVCGQARKYIDGDEHSVVITKIGRINDAVVMPPPGTALEISPEESRLVKEGWDIINVRDANRKAKGAPRALKIETKTPVPETKTPTNVTKTPVPETKTPTNVTKTDLTEPGPPVRGTKKPYFDKRRKEILEDYGKMTVRELEEKWKMRKGGWYSLQVRWKNEGYTIPVAFADKAPEPKPEPKPESKVNAEKEERKTNLDVERRTLGYWKRHREEVMGDYQTMHVRKFLSKWHLSTQGWKTVRLGLEIPNKGYLVPLSFPKLPSFPEFNQDWKAATQVEWLKS